MIRANEKDPGSLKRLIEVLHRTHVNANICGFNACHLFLIALGEAMVLTAAITKTRVLEGQKVRPDTLNQLSGCVRAVMGNGDKVIKEIVNRYAPLHKVKHLRNEGKINAERVYALVQTLIEKIHVDEMTDYQ